MYSHETPTTMQDHSIGHEPTYSGLTTSESSTALTPPSATSNHYSVKSFARSRSSTDSSRAATSSCKSSIENDGSLCYTSWMLGRYLQDTTNLEGLFTEIALNQAPLRNSESHGTLQQTMLVDDHDVTGDCGASCQLELELDEHFQTCGGSMVDEKGHLITSDCGCILSNFRER